MRIFHKKAVLILFGIFILSYGLFQARGYLAGPQLWLENPPEGAVLKESLLIVKGRATDVSRLTLNGRQIFTNEAGEFSEEILIAAGVNIIQLEAEDKFGKRNIITRTVLLK